MLKQSKSDKIVGYFGRTIAWLARYFSEARTLKSYSNRGYFLLGVLVFILVTLLGLTGLWEWTISSLPQSVQESVQVLLGLIPSLKFSGSTPILILVVAILILLAPFEKTRGFLGEKTANLVIWLFDRAISAGEYCIAHRRFSMALIITMMAFLAWGAYLESKIVREANQLSADFHHWLDAADEFTRQSTVTRSENIEYKREVQQLWRDGFKLLLKLPNNQVHPVTSLNEIFETLYSSANDQASWRTFLKENENKLEDIFTRCHQRPKPQLTIEEMRSWVMLSLTMGRIYVRLAQYYLENKDLPRSQEYLAKARQVFLAIKDTANNPLLTQCSSEKVRDYHSAIDNGLGTVYSNALNVYLLNARANSENINKELDCRDLRSCATQAYEKYRVAGKGYEKCSFENKRMINNTADLLLKIGLAFDKFTERPLLSISGPKIDTPAEMAREIESNVSELLSCNATSPILPPVFVTAAQAFGACVPLMEKSRKNPTEELEAAVLYLRLAYGFDPKNFHDWDMKPFCFTVKNKNLIKKFEAAMRSHPDSLPKLKDNDLHELIKDMGQLCRASQ